MVLLQFNLYFIVIRRFNDKQVKKSWYTIAQKVYLNMAKDQMLTQNFFKTYDNGRYRYTVFNFIVISSFIRKL